MFNRLQKRNTTETSKYWIINVEVMALIFGLTLIIEPSSITACQGNIIENGRLIIVLVAATTKVLKNENLSL
ncbi:hypothetical protein [Lacticaseibacillus rhamnosus]|uniref:hypothetical protein n=1 Tax=Lacticaseibacillus rhamnosus TaxID=47715 RepID=UPI001192DAC0|nr:hypothetical protein [Lacticaseibacillus rhamnosus]GEM60444.1 hypothetical protein LR1_11260 [Lacticaseibacillus rhamnosus DSM 20021 = JCM 1136 = NBRC 3425]